MLQAIREKAQGWIAWAIVILITIPFALWGIQEYLGVGGEEIAADVNGSTISVRSLDEQTRQTRNRLRTQLGSAYRAELFPEQMLRRQTLDRMIDERVLQQTALDWGMRPGEQMVASAIRGEQAFQNNGQFDNDLYQTILRNNGLSEAEYWASVRQTLTLQQLQQGIVGSAFATKSQVDEYQRLRGQKRTLSYVVIPADTFMADIHPDDAAVEAYFQAHKDRYQLPERVKLNYVVLDVKALADQVKTDPATVKAWYEQHRDEFVAPEERHLRHILIPVKDGDDAAAKAKAQAIHDKLVAGADFAELAKQDSADPGSADKGGDLGWVSHGMMVDAFEKAAFAMKKGEISEPVKTPFGYHIIQVEGIRGGGDTDFAQVAEQATAAYQKSEAERVFFERSERLAELAYENPDNLSETAAALGLKVQHSDWIDRSGGPGDLSSPKVTAAAFSDDVLTQGHNSELLELAPERQLVLRVVDHQAARPEQLSEVRDKVVLALRTEKAAEAAHKAGEAALAAAKDGADIAKLGEGKHWQYHGDVVASRDDPDVPPGVRELVFELPHPGDKGAQYAGTALSTGDYAVLKLTAVTDGDPAKLADTARQLLASRLSAQAGNMDLSGLVVALRDRADVEVQLKDKPAEE